jgi:hypothetical protein
MSDKREDDQLPEKEIAERMEKALRRSFSMRHKPHKASGKKQARKPARKKKGR